MAVKRRSRSRGRKGSKRVKFAPRRKFVGPSRRLRSDSSSFITWGGEKRRAGIPISGGRSRARARLNPSAPASRSSSVMSRRSSTGMGVRRRVRRNLFGMGPACPELSRFSRRAGRRKPMTVNKLVNLTVPKQITRFACVTPYLNEKSVVEGSLAGALPMYFAKNVYGSGVTASAFPCYLLSLDDVCGNTQTANNYATNVLYRLHITGRGTPFWLPVTAFGPGGGNDKKDLPTCEWGQGKGMYNYPFPHNPGDTITPYMKYAQHKWHDFRFMFYGARTQPTQWEVRIIRPKEQYMDPRAQMQSQVFATTPTSYSSTNPAYGTGQSLSELWAWNSEAERDEYAAYWQNMVHNLTTNPMLPKFNVKRGKFSVRTLKKYVIDVPCKTSYQSVAYPNSKLFKLFYRDDRMLHMQWTATATAYDSTKTDKDDEATATRVYRVQTDVTDTQEMPRPAARTYVMIRCLNYIPDTVGVSSLTGVNIDTCPSFDMVWRRKSAYTVYDL